MKIEHKLVSVNGLNMQIAELGKGPLVLFLHGFPELWYSCRHQILFLADHGFQAVAPDLRGYGDTIGAPVNDPSMFTIFHIIGDLISLLDVIAADQGEEPGDIEAEFGKIDTKTVVTKFLTTFTPGTLYLQKGKGFDDTPAVLPPWLSSEDVEYFDNKFDQTGFTGGLNYYRAIDKNWELTAAWTGAKVKVPAMFVIGDSDLVYHMPGVRDFIHNGGFQKDVPLLEEVVVVKVLRSKPGSYLLYR